MKRMKQYVCIDIGGTSIKYGLADEQGIFTAKSSMDTEAREKGAEGIQEKILSIVDGYRELHEVDGVAVSTAGIVDPQEGRIIYAGGSFPGYTGTRLRELVERSCELPCTVENDVNCAGLGEFWLGAAQGTKSAFCITVGTGIGGCVLLDGRVWHGSGCSAGEIGYMQVGGPGTLEDLASTRHMVEEAAESHHTPVSEVDGKMVFDWARAGDADAVNAIAHMLTPLAKGICNVCYVLNPEVVVVGGGIMAQEAYLKPRLMLELQERMLPSVLEHTRLEFASLKNDAGMLGALYYFLQSAPRD